MGDIINTPNPPIIKIILCCLVVLLGLAPVPAIAQEEIKISEVSFDEENIVENRNGQIFLWQPDSVTLSVTIQTGDTEGEGHYELCITSELHSNRSTLEVACQPTTLAGNSTEQITTEFDAWPAQQLGAQTVNVVIIANTLSRDVAAKESISVYPMEKDADLDNDGLTNQHEVDVGTNFTNADTDGDGLSDGLELETYSTDPKEPDTDGDELTDGTEVSEYETDPSTADTDDDSLSDGDEILTHGTDPNQADTDGDGLSDGEEIHTYNTDPTDPDTDGDGLDDFAEVNTYDTDPAEIDTDGDGLVDSLEVYTYETDPRKPDTDEDGLDDGAEVYEYNTDPTNADTDEDGLKDGLEVIAHDTNPNKADTDGDGLSDGAEINTYATDPTMADTDGDGQDDSQEVDQSSSLFTRLGWIIIGLGIALAGGILLIRQYGHTALIQSLARRSSADDPQRTLSSASDPGRSSTSDSQDHQPLTNEGRVLALLETKGGRMQQSTIVDETDWSKAKVSRVLKKMEENDQITKINIGRENIITLPDHEPKQSNSPFDIDKSDRPIK